MNHYGEKNAVQQSYKEIGHHIPHLHHQHENREFELKHLLSEEGIDVKKSYQRIQTYKHKEKHSKMQIEVQVFRAAMDQLLM